ncbi:unnamed protein product [Clavelina lepadiformis]|uniref:Uncharacterized protein n=1 Tax=Clavelina lepadiformis TaxID=159417 RepID=A0ABP0FBJ3_CLALP
MASSGTDNLDSTETAQAVIDVALLRCYIVNIVPILLEGGLESSNSLEKKLQEQSVKDLLNKFVGDGQIKTLMVERLSSKDDNDDSEEKEVRYCVSLDVHYTSGKASGLVLIKRGPLVIANKSVGSQVHAITLIEDSPYETLHSLVSCAFAPFFKSYVQKSGKLDRLADAVHPSGKCKRWCVDDLFSGTWTTVAFTQKKVPATNFNTHEPVSYVAQPNTRKSGC